MRLKEILFTHKKNEVHKKPRFSALDILKYVGPGLLVTVGFIDPGNWACNISAGSEYGYSLLWIISLSTLMLIILQHNIAHLGIVTGKCLSEAASQYFPRGISIPLLSTAMIASISTSLAEILGASIGLSMLTNIPYLILALLVSALILVMLFTNSYRKIERWIIGFVSLIGISFIYELTLVKINWLDAAVSMVKPDFPSGAMLIIMSVMGAVVMPHNLFLHSEIIQSRQWNLKNEKIINRQLKYEYFDTIFSMLVGWAINSAMILLAAVFFQKHIAIQELGQAFEILKPLLGSNSALIFALALFFSGVASCITSGMAGGVIYAGIFGESYDIKDKHTWTGVLISILGAFLILFFIDNPLKGLIISQMILSIQLPFTIFLQIYLTSSKKVMGKYVNSLFTKIILFAIGAVVVYLNIRLFISFILSK